MNKVIKKLLKQVEDVMYSIRAASAPIYTTKRYCTDGYYYFTFCGIEEDAKWGVELGKLKIDDILKVPQLADIMLDGRKMKRPYPYLGAVCILLKKLYK